MSRPGPSWIPIVAIGTALGAIALALSSRNSSASTPKKVSEFPVRAGLVGPDYLVKYNAQALQLAALPSQDGPVMLCSYIPFAQLESQDLASAQTAFQRLKSEHETTPERIYGRTGRRHIVRLVKRYFDPKTFKELPSDILYESDQKFPIPVSPDPGVPCG